MEASSQGAPAGAPYRAFRHDDGRLKAEEADVAALADRFGTPLYVYSARTIRDRFARVRAALRVGADVQLLGEGEPNPAPLRPCATRAPASTSSPAAIERCPKAGVAPSARPRRRLRDASSGRSRPASASSTSSRPTSSATSPGSRAPRRGRGPPRSRCASTPTSTPAPTST